MFTESKIPDTILENSGICQNCFIKFNEYDEHQTLARQIQEELTLLYRRETPDYIDEKPEVKIELEDCYYAFEENVEVVEYSQSILETQEQVQICYDEPDDVKPKTSSKAPPVVKTQRKSNESNRADKDAGLIVVMINGVKHYKCEFCGKKDFTSRSRIKTHRLIHTSERNFMCQECGSSFKTMNCLKNHSRLHNNIFYYCDLCMARFKGKHELRCHMDAVHLGKKDQLVVEFICVATFYQAFTFSVCQICGKAFSRDKTLRQHLMYHQNERNIVCEVCGFKTVNKPKMTRHMKSHTGEIAFIVGG